MAKPSYQPSQAMARASSKAILMRRRPPMSQPPTTTTRATTLGSNGCPRSTGRRQSLLIDMNAKGSPTTTQYTNTDVQDVLTGTSDIKSEDPAIKYVLPYLSANAGVYGSWVNDAYWSTARNLAIAQGGFGIDVPVGYYLHNPDAYRQVVKDQITWGIQNNLIVVVLLSPWDIQNPNCNPSPSFCADPNFMSSSQAVVTDLVNSGVYPTTYIVSNYSEQSASPQPGTDDASSPPYTPNSIFAVAYAGIQAGVPTSPYPTSAAGIESP